MCFTYITISIALPITLKSLATKVVLGKPHVRLDMFSFECQSSHRFHHTKMCFTYITILIVLPVSVKRPEVKVVYGKPHVRIDMRLLVCQFFLRFHRTKR